MSRKKQAFINLVFMKKITCLLFKLYPGWFQNWSVLALNALSANKNRLGLEIGLFIQHSKWKHWDDWTVHLALWFYSETLFPLHAFMNWQKAPSQDCRIMLSLLLPPCQQKLSHKRKYPPYRTEMEALSFGVCSVASWPTLHPTRMPNGICCSG